MVACPAVPAGGAGCGGGLVGWAGCDGSADCDDCVTIQCCTLQSCLTRRSGLAGSGRWCDNTGLYVTELSDPAERTGRLREVV